MAERARAVGEAVAQITSGPSPATRQARVAPPVSTHKPHQFVLVEAFRDGEAGGAHVNSDHFKTAMAWMPEVIAEKPEIINVEVPGDGWSRMAELTPVEA